MLRDINYNGFVYGLSRSIILHVSEFFFKLNDELKWHFNMLQSVRK